MTKAVYALLIGVNKYLGKVSDLRGCGEDIRNFHIYLQGRVAVQNYRYEPKLLFDEEATRQNIIDAFRSHLGQAKKEDEVIVYFSGHGAQTKVPEVLKYLEPTGRMQSLVCHDSRVGDGADLVDKEFGYLIHELSQNEPNITVILDCCHSGAGTRSDEVGIRQAPLDERERSVESFLFRENSQLFNEMMNSQGDGRLHLPKGEHILLAACQSGEYAKERPVDGVPKGIFSYFLLDSLKSSGHSLTYRDLYMRVNALVKANVSEQAPQLETIHTANPNRQFLGGAIKPAPKHFTVSFDKKWGWVVDAGAIHGIKPPKKGETTHFALFPFDATDNDLRDLTKSYKSVSVRAVMSTHSKVTNAQLDPYTTYKAVVTSLPINPLLVTLSGEETAVSLIREALATYGPDGKASFFVREAEQEESSLLVLAATSDDYTIRRVGDVAAQVVGPGVTVPETAKTAVGQLEHIARWHNLMQLEHPANNLDTNSIKLRFEVEDSDGRWVDVPTDREIQLKYHPTEAPDVWQKPKFRMSLKNEGSERLFCMLLDLTEKYKISSLTESDGQWLDEGNEYWLFDGDALAGTLPDDYWQQQRTTFQDTLKLIVTTEASYARLLEQGDLPVRVTSTKSLPADVPQADTLTRLMYLVNTRDLARAKSPSTVSAWYTLETVFTTERPKAAKFVLE